jgi:predicted DsbA family dithiol-disulfide isomerase
VKVEIWSDVACPWCYVGKRRLDAALARFEHAASVEVRFRSFELDPSAPAEREGSYAERLSAKYRIGRSEAEDMIDTMLEAGARAGAVLRFDRAKAGNTFDAHRLLHWAAERGAQAELKERMLRATFTRGEVVADPGVLVAVAEAAGLDPAEARAVVESDRYADDVRADERRAAELGITSVPFFVVARTYGVAGAQPPELLLQVLQEAWAATSGDYS